MRTFFIATISILAFAFLLQSKMIYAGTLSCSVRTSSCNADEVEVFEMQNTTNSHAGLSAASYTNLVCCGGITGIGNSCSGTFATVLKLSGTTNAHVRQNSLADYPSATNACISVPSGGTISVGYVTSPTTCTGAGYDTTIGSMVGTTNSHIGSSAWTNGTTKICGTSTPPTGLPISATLTSSVFDTNVTTGSVGYNSIMWKGLLGGAGFNEGKVRFQFAAAAAPTGPWSFLGGATCGALDWFDTTSPDSPVELKGSTCLSNWNNKRYARYKVQLCSNDCVSAGSNTPTITDIIFNVSS